jgi:hypothetical protein
MTVTANVYQATHNQPLSQSWRHVESELVRFFRSHGCQIRGGDGCFYISIEADDRDSIGDDLDFCVSEICLTDLAHEIARL